MYVTTTHGAVSIANPVRYPLDQILLMHTLANREGAIVHAAGLELDGIGLLFPGESGAGKSTLTRLVHGRPRVRLLSDDRIVVRHGRRGFRAYGTPWPGDALVAENTNMGLDALLFIRHGRQNRARALDGSEALRRLLPVVAVPWYDRESAEHLLAFCDSLCTAIPAYEFDAVESEDAALFLEDFCAAHMH
jgi:hypothetical protein